MKKVVLLLLITFVRHLILLTYIILYRDSKSFISYIGFKRNQIWQKFEINGHLKRDWEFLKKCKYVLMTKELFIN